MNTRSLIAFVALASAALAQQGTSPHTFVAAEGDSSFKTLCGYVSNMRTHYTQVDKTLAGLGARSVQKLHLRRDAALATDATYVARSLSFAVRMAHADWAKIVNNATVQDATMRKGNWQLAFTEKIVNLPSFVTKPAASPAAWSIALLLDAAFAYNGNDALAIGIDIGASSASAGKQYPLDGAGKENYTLSANTKLGTGCQVAGQASPFSLGAWVYNYGEAASDDALQFSVWYGKPGTPVTIVLGIGSPGVPFGACEKLLASPEVVFTPAATNGSGFWSDFLYFPHNQAFIGTTVYAQAAQPDAGQAGAPIALTNGVAAKYPANPVLMPVARDFHWTASTAFPTSYLFHKGSSLVIGLSW